MQPGDRCFLAAMGYGWGPKGFGDRLHSGGDQATWPWPKPTLGEQRRGLRGKGFFRWMGQGFRDIYWYNLAGIADYSIICAIASLRLLAREEGVF